MENGRLVELRKELFQLRYEMTIFRRKMAEDPAYAQKLKDRLKALKREITQEMVKQEGGKSK